jgi:fructosamine-3-kinase
VGGAAAIIDPAVYRGDREVDLAMSQLFGGFSRAFYEAYDAAWPVDAGYEERRDVYNLYHLINHLNHFGSSYAGGVASILRRFT